MPVISEWWRSAQVPCPRCAAQTTAPILIDDASVDPLSWPETKWTVFFLCPNSQCGHMWHEPWLSWKKRHDAEQRALAAWTA